jgi:hypothetical protein
MRESMVRMMRMMKRMRRVREAIKTLMTTRMTNPNPIIKKNDLFVLFMQMDICSLSLAKMSHNVHKTQRISTLVIY